MKGGLESMLIIIKKVIKNQIRNPKWFLFLMIFPILLILLISSILNQAFDDKSNLNKVEVVLYDKKPEGLGSEVIDALTSASVSIEKDYGILINNINSEKKGKDQARINKKVFVFIDKEKIQVFGNDTEPLDAARVVALFRSIACSIQTVREAYRIEGDNALNMIGTDNATYEVETKMIPDESSMSSYDYYGVVEISLMILYMILIPLGDLFRDKESQVKERILLSGLSRVQYYISSLIAYCFIAVVAFLPAFLFSCYYLGVNWGKMPLLIYAYLMVFAIFNITIGMLFGVFLGNRGKVEAFLSVIIIPIFSFLGGSYTPFPYDMDGFFSKVMLISPLRWVNVSIFKSIYGKTISPQIITTFLFIILILINIGVIINRDKKEYSK